MNNFVSPLSPGQIEYRAYLRTQRWRWLRWLRRRIDGNRCRLCGASARLEVHHARYDNLGGVWWRELADCITLCDKCHGKIHGDNEHA
jgi:5-methylcytosine-specific restriction endonuclease McrA